MEEQIADLAAQVAALHKADASALPALVRCPTLSVLAASDLLIPEAAARAALAPIADLTITTIPEAGHSIHWDAPAQTLAALLPFLKEGRQ